MDEPHITQQLDDVVHQRVRLGILAILHDVAQANFSYLRRELRVTDGNLSAHMQALADAGLITVKKDFANRKPQTIASATRAGRAAYAREITIMRQLVQEADH